MLINICGFNSVTYLYVPRSARNKAVANRCGTDWTSRFCLLNSAKYIALYIVGISKWSWNGHRQSHLKSFCCLRVRLWHPREGVWPPCTRRSSSPALLYQNSLPGWFHLASRLKFPLCWCCSSISSPDLTPDLQIQRSNCPLDNCTWISSRHLNLNVSNNEFLILCCQFALSGAFPISAKQLHPSSCSGQKLQHRPCLTSSLFLTWNRSQALLALPSAYIHNPTSSLHRPNHVTSCLHDCSLLTDLPNSNLLPTVYFQHGGQ